MKPLQHMPFLVSVLLLPLLWSCSVTADSGPSFDCSRAKSRVERTICKQGNGELQKADRELAGQYLSLRKNLSGEWGSWLRSSQRDWLRWRDWHCGNQYDSMYDECLIEHYHKRINEFRLGIVSRPIESNKLPFVLTLPGILNGKLVLESFNSPASEGAGERMHQQLFYGTADAEQLLWSGVSIDHDGHADSDTLEWVTVTLMADRQVMLEVVHKVFEYTGGYADRSKLASTYLSYVPQGKFVLQGKSGFGIAGYDYFTRYRSRWLSGSESIQLQISQRDWYVHDSRYLSDNYQYHRYHVRFDGQPWEELPADSLQWLEKPDEAARKLASFTGPAITGRRERSGDVKQCVSEGVDYALAAQGLAEWLDIVRAAQVDGLNYKQGPAIVKTLLEKRPAFSISNSQQELFSALEYHRQLIEAPPDWQQRLSHLYKYFGGHHHEGFNEPLGRSSQMARRIVEQGFPAINLHCASEARVPGYEEIPFDDWLYSFWVRRHGDGTYPLAVRLIEYLKTQG